MLGSRSRGAAAGDCRCPRRTAAPPAVPAAQQTSAEDQAENNGQDFIRPVNLLQLRYEYSTAPGSGSEPGTIRQVTSDIVSLRADHRIDLVPQWALGLRANLPFLAKNPISSDNPTGEYRYGVGDADVQAALMHQLDTRWAAGFSLPPPVGTSSAAANGRSCRHSACATRCPK